MVTTSSSGAGLAHLILSSEVIRSLAASCPALWVLCSCACTRVPSFAGLWIFCWCLPGGFGLAGGFGPPPSQPVPCDAGWEWFLSAPVCKRGSQATSPWIFLLENLPVAISSHLHRKRCLQEQEGLFFKYVHTRNLYVSCLNTSPVLLIGVGICTTVT